MIGHSGQAIESWATAYSRSDRFSTEPREALGDDGFTGAAKARHRLAYGES
ncbi:hypothetical protein OG426_04440 [Streptomyces canus]|uniref:hypothetical protein n=1 Tax=Streptomyces canus TaxID=58343 RepID=UPI003868DE3C|nr:hypothetical protein OG426_04440 [Streptomyces canus]